MNYPMIFPLALLSALVTSQITHAQTYLGYVEAEYVRAAPSAAGRMTQIHVVRGQRVDLGALIANLDDTLESAQVDDMRAKLQQALAQLNDLESARRAPEIEVLEQQRKQALAQLNLSRAQVERFRALAKTGVASRETLDQAIMAVTRDEARVNELNSQLALSRQSTGRESTIDAARANLESIKANLVQAEWRLSERKILAGTAGTIADVIYRPGEMIASGATIALILSPEFIKARFYVPQADLSKMQIGRKVDLRCDGCAKAIAAQISYVAPDAEFTPPVIYSDQARDKLMFMIEARSVDGLLPIAPGQPVTVSLSSGGQP